MGHTKNICDRRFKDLKHRYHNRNVYTVNQLIKVLAEDNNNYAKNLFEDFYREAIFTHVSDQDIFLKQVVNTNKCLIHLKQHKNKLINAPHTCVPNFTSCVCFKPAISLHKYPFICIKDGIYHCYGKHSNSLTSNSYEQQYSFHH